ncbi:hypothetical protein [Thiocystis minor]|nr:hypothetical protein [Thiocystis minor]
MQDHNGVRDGFLTRESRFDLAQFDANTPQFDLMVDASEEFQLTIRA